ncbi:hypothetical protein M422DRAFT_262619 [Sphaerobolus stellatus SS14]|uniref:Uncharacterized protein n=1 Tax=Sphaerobolus stellatus (strain SS14) TaxID=990650 RepID=A0A0C9VCI4_SPHS4|nr:hypothetical protein M422DRAFT_262619 [Sphaerobolus stellatus SS14]
MPHIPNHSWLYPKSTVPAPQADTVLLATRPAWNHMEVKMKELIYDPRGSSGVDATEVSLRIINAEKCRDRRAMPGSAGISAQEE